MGESAVIFFKYHPDTMIANRAVRIFNDKAMMHFRKILQHGHKQLTLDKFLVKRLGKQQQRKNCQPRARDREGINRQNLNCPVFLWMNTPLKRYVCK